VLDVIDQCRQRSLEWRGQPALDLLRTEARVAVGHRNDRDVDVRENVGWREQAGTDPGDENGNSQHDERVRLIEGKFDDPHGQKAGYTGRSYS
jgi:hypothetical protein